MNLNIDLSHNQILLEVNQIQKKFSESDILFTRLDLKIKKNEWLTLLGLSGCGKTSLLKILSGLDNNFEGSRIINPKTQIAHVFQDARLLPWLNIEENLVLPIKLNKSIHDYNKIDFKQKVDEELLRVRLDPKKVKNLFPYQLSGGMKFRVALARALLQKPDILFLDEPFSALDEVTKFELMDEVRNLKKKLSLTVIMVTHSLDEALSLSTRICLLATKGRLIKEIENNHADNLNKDLDYQVRKNNLFLALKDSTNI